MTRIVMIRRVLKPPLAVVLICIPVILFLTSCGSPTDPHENFKTIHDWYIDRGMSIDNEWVTSTYGGLVESRRLPNGNIENKYKKWRTCHKFYEFNPDTRMIVRWRFEGKTEDCTIRP